MDILAKLMGHDIYVHREYYRLPAETLQLTIISKVLIALEKGGNITGSQANSSALLCSGRQLKTHNLRCHHATKRIYSFR